MTKADKAVEIFLQEFNSAQSVLAAFGPQYGLEYNTCFRIASSFGAGYGRMQNTCGAVTGALMVIGLMNGRSPLDDEYQKDINYEATLDFIDRFKDLHGSINCRELLGYDFNNDADRQKIEQLQLMANRCSKYVRSAVEILKGYK